MTVRELTLMQAKLSLSEEGLLQEIGTSLAITEGFDLGPLHPEELRNKAELWLQLNRAKFVELICKGWKFSEKTKDAQYQDDVRWAAAIADVIAGFAIKVAPFTVAALLTKRGLHSLCG